MLAGESPMVANLHLVNDPLLSVELGLAGHSPTRMGNNPRVGLGLSLTPPHAVNTPPVADAVPPADELRAAPELQTDDIVRTDDLQETDGPPPPTETPPSTETPPLHEPQPSTEPQPAAAAARAANEILCICTNFFPETDDPDVDKDRWMTVRTFISAMLAEPVLNVFGGATLSTSRCWRAR